LQQELYKREGGFVRNNDTGVESRIGGTPMDPKTLKMLENIGMVKKGNLNKMDAPALAKATTAINAPLRQPAPQAIQLGNGLGSYGGSTAPRAGRLESPIIYNGQEEGNGPKVYHVGAPSNGGFFENLSRQSNAIRQNKERIAADRFERKQKLAEDLARSEMAYRQKRTDMYDDIAIAGIR